MRQTVCAFFAMLLNLSAPIRISASLNNSPVSTARIDASSLKALTPYPIIESFDLSPDGRTIALLVAAGSNIGAPLWMVTEDATKHILSAIEVGTSVFPSGGFIPQVIYSSNGRYLIVQDLRSIRVIDSSNLKTLRTIAPPSDKAEQIPLFAVGAATSNVFACAFGVESKFNPRLHTTPVRVEVIDVSSGTLLGSWESEDIPQSISPDGNFVAASSSRPQKGVLPLNIFDSRGRIIVALDGGFSFQDSDQSKPLGRVVGLFVGEKKLLLTPDENFDRSGNPSGDSVRLVSFAEGQAQTNISLRPRQYRATGEMAVSSDGKMAVTLSWYVPSRLLRSEWALPPSSPKMMVIAMDATTRLEATINIRPLGLGFSSWKENRRPRLSSDGRVIALAQDNGVTLFTHGPSSLQ